MELIVFFVVVQLVVLLVGGQRGYAKGEREGSFLAETLVPNNTVPRGHFPILAKIIRRERDRKGSVDLSTIDAEGV